MKDREKHIAGATMEVAIWLLGWVERWGLTMEERDGILRAALREEAPGRHQSLWEIRERHQYKQMTHSAIVLHIAGQRGWDCLVDPTEEVHDTVIRQEETDEHFLETLARKNGFAFFVRNGVIHWHGDRDTGPEKL